MTDRLGYRLKLGVVIPSTNTIVQPETDAMRPQGVTNHIGRIHIPDLPLTSDAEFEQIIDAIGPDLFGALDRVMSCKPAHLIMAMSIPTFWGGMAGAESLRARLEARAAVRVFARLVGLRRGAAKVPAGSHHRHPDALSACGRCPGRTVLRGGRMARRRGPQPKTAERSADRARHRSRIARRIARPRRQGGGRHRSGRNRPGMADLAGEAERWLGIPVIAINVATYWSALRANGIHDRMRGFGALLYEH